MEPDQVVAGLVGMGFSLSDIANALEVKIEDNTSDERKMKIVRGKIVA
uniref:UBA domain-containing protein n=1 Tax=Solanum lycopersicum TaxID=4081 RepID=K4D0G6_SOLLC